MKNFILGVLFAFCLSAGAIEWNQDGGATLTAGEVEQTRVAFYQLQHNFELAVQQVGELRKKVDELEARRCL